MAIVGTAYSVERYVRTPEQILAALFGDPQPTRRLDPCLRTSTCGRACRATAATAC